MRTNLPIYGETNAPIFPLVRQMPSKVALMTVGKLSVVIR